MNQAERLKQVAEKTLAMRTAQKQYFRTRDRDDLSRSKALEREVDKLLPAALQDDDMFQMMESASTVFSLPPPTGRDGAERVVTDVLEMLVGAIAVGGGCRKAKVRSDGSDWRVREWLGL